MPKAIVLVPFALDKDGIDNRRQQLTKVKLGPDIEFNFKPVTAGPEMYMSTHDFAFMDMAIFEAGLNAEKDGYDAVCIDTMSDSGMEPLRSVLDIPVISPGKLSMLFALNMGNKFGLLAQWEPAKIRTEKFVKSLGLDRFCAAIENYDEPPDYKNLLTGKEDRTLPKMKLACERAIEKGADVICLGSTTMYQAHEYLSKELPVPVINPGPLTYKITEAMIDLKLTHSRKPYPKPIKPHNNIIHSMFKVAAEKMK